MVIAMDYKDYYKILGVDRKADPDEIKRAYRSLARKYHPDLNKQPEAEQKFKDIGEAYEVLKDPEKRATYDDFTSGRQTGRPFRPRPQQYENFSFDTSGEQFGFSDFFEELFGKARWSGHETRTSLRARGEDQHAKLSIRLADAYHGASKNITLNRATIDARDQIITTPQSLHVKIPKGIIEGQRIRLEGLGGPGLGGGPAGDLYIEINFEQDPIFHAEKRDIHITVPITCWEAALGAVITVPTLGGDVQLTIPPGSETGRKLRLKGRGISSTNQSGDQYVTLRLVTPVPKTEEEKRLYREMARLMPMNPRKKLGV